MDKRAILAITVVLLIFAVILVYEWGGSWQGYKSALKDQKQITKEFLEEKQIPIYALVIFTVVEYIKYSWLCLLLAFLAAGAIQEFIPQEKVMKLLGSGRGFLPYLIGAGGGPVLSMCSCSVIPIFGGLYRRGAGLGPAIAFLLAAPAFNPAALFLNFALLGWKFTVARVIVAMSSGMLVGYITDKVMAKRIKKPEPLHIESEAGIAEEEKSFGKRIVNMLLYSWEFVKMVLPLILLGVVFAGLIKAFLPPSFIIKYLGAGIFPIMLASAIGVLMYVPGIVEAPLIRGLLESGMGTGAAMAHLLTGPALSLPSILGVCKIVDPKVPAFYSVLMWICGVVAGLVFWILVPKF